ncbi:MAG: putative DNA-binding domain-containing protein [Prolixibacteraceae bacterium]|nr:putative DNA-binding domain-containing protein [Burkholderiales bacterium]
MRELAMLQAQFGAALNAPDSEAGALELFVGETGQVKNRFGIYRGNTTANAAKALSCVYPVVEKIVGAEFFSGLARQYQSRFPSHNGDLNEYGEAFAAFLAAFPPAQEIPYLADVASVEWRVHRAHYAADLAPFDPTRLACVPPEQQSLLRPQLHPACHVLQSAYPAARIWEVHQDTFSGKFEVDLSPGATHALVYRPHFRVEVAQISDAEAAFLGAALEAQTLEVALAAAQSSEASFDLGRALSRWVESSVIVDFKRNAE